MFGMLAKMRAHPGQRDALAAVMLGSIGEMPGCLSYIVANDSVEPDTLWVIEAWADKASHDASLTLPAVQSAIAQARPLIAALESNVIVEPVGGVGLGRQRP